MFTARGRRTVAAEVLSLCRRRHRRLSAWSATDAPGAMGQARRRDRTAFRGEGHAAGSRPEPRAAGEELFVGQEVEVDRARPGRPILLLPRQRLGRGVGPPDLGILRRGGRRALHDRGRRRRLCRDGAGLDENDRLLSRRDPFVDRRRCARRPGAQARRSLNRLERGRGRHVRPSGRGAESRLGAECGQRRARQLRQARQRLPCDCDPN